MSSENQRNTSINASTGKGKTLILTLVLALTFVLASGPFLNEISILVLVLVPAWLVKTRLKCCIYQKSEKKQLTAYFSNGKKSQGSHRVLKLLF